MILPLMATCFGAAFLLAWGLNWLALIPWRRSAGRHWTERARLLYPARISSRLNLWLIPLIAILTSLALTPEVSPFYAAAAALPGALLGGYPMSRELFPEIQFRLWLHLVLSTLLLLLGFCLVVLFGALAMPEHFGPLAWVIAGTVLFLQVAFLSGFGVRLMRWLRLLKPAPAKSLSWPCVLATACVLFFPVLAAVTKAFYMAFGNDLLLHFNQ